MSLKSIKESYKNLMDSFEKAGISLNESQKESLDTFMVDLELTIHKTRDTAIRETKRIMESKNQQEIEKLESEYKTVVESIINHQTELQSATEKLNSKLISIDESKKISDVVEEYVNEFSKELVSEKLMVDYSKMKKYESLFESLKNILQTSDINVSEKIVKENCELKEKCSELEKKLSEKEDEQEKGTEEEKVEKVETENKEVEKVEESIEEETEVSSEDTEKKEQIQEVEKTIDQIIQDKVEEKEEEKEEKSSEEIVDNQEETVATEEPTDEKNLDEAIKEILCDEKTSSDKTTCDKDVEVKENNSETIDEEEDEAMCSKYMVSESLMETWINNLNRITPKQ